MSEDISYVKMRDDFLVNYQKKLAPSIESFKKERILKLKIIQTIKIILILASIISLSLIFINQNSSIENKILLTIFALAFIILAFMFENCLKKNIDISLKKKVMPSTCLLMGDLTWIDGKGGGYKNSNLFKRSLILNNYNECTFGDIFVSKNMDSKLDIVELNLFRTVNNNKYSVFEGIIIKYDLTKTLKGHTVVCQNADNNTNKHISAKLNSIEINRADFEELESLNIKVYSNNPTEVGDLVTPSFLHHINNIKTAYRAKQLSCALFENSIVIAIPSNKKIFSLDEIINNNNNSKYFFNFYEKIISTFRFMDYFKLNS